MVSMTPFRKQMPDFKKSKTSHSNFPTLQGGTQGTRDYKLCANYDIMFGDTRPRVRIKASSHEVQISDGGMRTIPKSRKDFKELMEVQGSHRTLFYRQPSRKHMSSYTTVVVDLDDGSKKVSFGSESDTEVRKPAMVITLPAKGEKMATKGTQTDYRESEAQTLPWKHEIKAEGKILAELMALEWFSLEKNFPPGMEEAVLIEKSREKIAWENIVTRLRGKENEEKRKDLVSRISATEIAFREGKLEETHRERIALSREMMREAREVFEDKLAMRLQKSYGIRRMENDEKIHYWKHQMSRQLRKIKTATNPPCRKRDIITAHVDKTSEIYAPLLRDGANPARGHEVINIQCRYLKRFHGLETLEKYISDILKPQFFKFDYGFSTKTKKPNLCPRKFKERAIEVPEEKRYDGSMFKVRVPVPAPTPEAHPTPRVTRSRTDSEEDLYQASLLLSRIVKGRAIQARKFLSLCKTASE